jgi:hypothetical protein
VFEDYTTHDSNAPLSFVEGRHPRTVEHGFVAAYHVLDSRLLVALAQLHGGLKGLQESNEFLDAVFRNPDEEIVFFRLSQAFGDSLKLIWTLDEGLQEPQLTVPSDLLKIKKEDKKEKQMESNK